MLTNEERAEGEVEDGDWEDIPVELRKATKQFLEELGRVPLNTSNGVVPWKSAVKFLMARKFDVRRAVDLYIEHEKIRQTEGIEGPDLRDPEIRRELLTQKFTVLPGRDKSGAAIALFRARYHHPEQTSHQATLQGLIFQLDAALESIETQRYGLVFIYDMTGSRYSNFDYDLSIKILNLLKGSYPARLKKVLIVTAPLWFKAPFKFLRLFVREKLRERVYTVDLSQLCHHIPTNVLPQYLGGKADFSHRAWLQVCLQQTWGSGTENEITAYLEDMDNFHLANDTSMSSISSCDDDFGGVGGATFSSDPESSLSSRSTINEKHTHEYREKEVILPLPSGAANMDTSDDDQSSSASANSPTKNGTPQLSRKRNLQGNAMAESVLIGDVPPPLPRKKCNLVVSAHDPIHVPDESGLTIDELVKYCKIKGKRGLYKEYAYVKLEPPTGRFEASKSKPNLPKNRYTDVLCLDQTRVKLNIVNDDTYSDYINANFLDGYKQKNAYISTQGPLPRTFGDFWRMVWEQMVLLVVMTTKTVERGRLKCGQYWPADKDSIDTYDDFVVINTGMTEHTEYTITTLILQNSKTGETRDIRHLQFTSWPDYGVPDSAHAFLDFMHLVRDTQAERVKELGAHWTGDARGPPIVIHCSAGIGRTGTFITMDISTQRLADIHTVDIRNTVRRIRTQRAFSIQMPDQYIFCHLALIEHAQSLGLLSEVDLDGFNDESSEDERVSMLFQTQQSFWVL